jgi:hypothetical protein
MATCRTGGLGPSSTNSCRYDTSGSGCGGRPLPDLPGGAPAAPTPDVAPRDFPGDTWCGGCRTLSARSRRDADLVADRRRGARARCAPPPRSRSQVGDPHNVHKVALPERVKPSASPSFASSSSSSSSYYRSESASSASSGRVQVLHRSVRFGGALVIPVVVDVGRGGHFGVDASVVQRCDFPSSSPPTTRADTLGCLWGPDAALPTPRPSLV